MTSEKTTSGGFELAEVTELPPLPQSASFFLSFFLSHVSLLPPFFSFHDSPPVVDFLFLSCSLSNLWAKLFYCLIRNYGDTSVLSPVCARQSDSLIKLHYPPHLFFFLFNFASYLLARLVWRVAAFLNSHQNVWRGDTARDLLTFFLCFHKTPVILPPPLHDVTVFDFF